MSNLSASQSTQLARPWLQGVYLGLAVAGSLLPWWFLAQFFQQSGVDLEAFFRQALANPVAIDLAIDLVISALAIFIWVWVELPRLGLSRRWWVLCIIVSLSISLSCGLPLFLWFRHRHLTP